MSYQKRKIIMWYQVQELTRQGLNKTQIHLETGLDRATVRKYQKMEEDEFHHWKKPNKRMRSYIRLGKSKEEAYAWSRSRMGGWAIAQSPIMRTTVTVSRLQRKGYISFSEQFAKSRRNVPQNVQLKFNFI